MPIEAVASFQLNKQPKLISLVKAELRERKQCEHDPEMFVSFITSIFLKFR